MFCEFLDSSLARYLPVFYFRSVLQVRSRCSALRLVCDAIGEHWNVMQDAVPWVIGNQLKLFDKPQFSFKVMKNVAKAVSRRFGRRLVSGSRVRAGS